MQSLEIDVENDLLLFSQKNKDRIIYTMVTLFNLWIDKHLYHLTSRYSEYIADAYSSQYTSPEDTINTHLLLYQRNYRLLVIRHILQYHQLPYDSMIDYWINEHISTKKINLKSIQKTSIKYTLLKILT